LFPFPRSSDENHVFTRVSGCGLLYERTQRDAPSSNHLNNAQFLDSREGFSPKSPVCGDYKGTMRRNCACFPGKLPYICSAKPRRSRTGPTSTICGIHSHVFPQFPFTKINSRFAGIGCTSSCDTVSLLTRMFLAELNTATAENRQRTRNQNTGEGYP